MELPGYTATRGSGDSIDCASGEDRWGNQVGQQRDLLVSGDDDRTRLRVLVDDRAWHVGDRAEVILHLREKPALALVTFQADRVLGLSPCAAPTRAKSPPARVG